MAGTGVSAPPHAGSEPLRIAGLYALAAAAWILASDVLLRQLTADGRHPVAWDVAKGWLFVAGTALLLLLLLRRTLGRVRAAEVRLQATVESLADGVLVVDADPGRIEQVLTNLLDNAIKYSPQGGEVTLAITPRRGEAVVSVEDAGLGIPPARQGQLFERYDRAHAGLPADRSGLGVGLHLSREIVARHGGRMWFQSEEARGSRFSFSLSLGVAHAEGRGHVGAAG